MAEEKTKKKTDTKKESKKESPKPPEPEVVEAVTEVAGGPRNESMWDMAEGRPGKQGRRMGTMADRSRA